MVSIFCGVMLALMLRFPVVVLQSALSGLEAFARSVLPTLFPYMVFCQLMSSRLSRLPRLPAVLPCALLGLLGGSPSGARLAALQYVSGRISRRSLRALCALCGTVSPIFLTGSIAVWAGSVPFGQCVLLAHWCGALLCGLIVATISPMHMPQAVLPSKQSCVSELRLTDAIVQSVQAMLCIGGCIALFSVLAAMPAAIFPSIPAYARAALHAALEMAGGSHALLTLHWPMRLRCCAVSACVSFGGFSILMQNLTFLRDASIRVWPLIRIRCAHAVIAAVLSWMLYPLLCA